MDPGDAVAAQVLERGAELGPPLPAELGATLYGEPLGEGPVPLLLLPSKRLVRRVKMNIINEKMSEMLRERYAVEDDN